MEQPGDYIVIGGGVFFLGQLKSAVNGGQVSTARLNQMVARILAPFYLLGQDSVRHYYSGSRDNLYPGLKS